jgi:cytochrome c oxidase subunit 4
MAEAIVGRKIYVLVWLTLMVLTGLTATLSFVDLGQWSAPVAIGIASVKVLLVALFFMHLRYTQSKIVWLWAIAGIFWLTILFFLSMTDYITRGFLRVPGK